MSKEGGLHLAHGKPRTLAFGDNVRKDLKLLELDEALLQELLDTGLSIKGADDEEAVLCTQNKTFAIKTVETSNSVWLVQSDQAAEGADENSFSQPAAPQCTPPGQLLGLATQLQRNQAAAARAPVVVTAVASSHLELIPAAPRLHALDSMLQERPYGRDCGGEQGEGAMEVDVGSIGSHGGRYTRDELLERVQASPAELDKALQDRHALCLEGRYCSVDPDYLGTLLEMLLLTAVEHGWAGGHAIPVQEAGRALEANGYDPRLTQHCLDVYGSRQGGSSCQGGDVPVAEQPPPPRSSSSGGCPGAVWRLNERAVCRHFARRLLAEQAQWEARQFMEAWQGSVPESMSPAWEMLRGEALVAGRHVKRFAVAALPADAAGRFAALFAERERWAWEDMEPYVEGLQGPGQTVEGLLLKYARASQPKPTDPVLYSAR